MFDLDKWSEIFRTLLRNKSRSLLTAFGIFWGVFMLVLLMGGANGFKDLMNRNFDGFAQNSYIAFPNNTSKPYKGFRTNRPWSLETTDVARVKSRIRGADVVTPLVLYWGTYKYKDKEAYGMLKGVRPEYAQIENPKISSGRFLQDADLSAYRKVCVIGHEVKDKLFPDGSDPIGKFISLRGVYYQVVGVSSNESNMSVGGSSGRSVLVPFSTLQRLENLGREIDMLALTAQPGYTISDIQPQVERLLKEIHAVAPDDKKALTSVNVETLFQMVQSLFNAINTLVWLIGIGTLVSGIIGVSNIMMVVVKERTTEIGIRRAIGARPANILSQILAESAVLTVAAGLSGIVLAVLILAGVEAGITAAMPDSAPPDFQISFGMAIGAAGILSILGTTAGIAPALRALAVKPIDAIRDE